MGTRNLTIVRLNGKVKVAQYCQWDGYPTGQGATIAKYLQSKSFNLELLKKNVAKLKWATAEEVKDTWTLAGADPNSDSVTFEIANTHKCLYPEFSRDTGAQVLPMIQNGLVSKVKNDHSFIKDSLFCEYAYEIDLTKKCVNVYKGFQSSGKTEVVKRADGSTYQREKYNPCKLFKRIAFKDFTVKAMKELEKEMNPDNE